MVKFEQAPDRFIELRRGALKENFGLEVGPFFRPICPKAEGYNSISLDVFSRDELIRNYAKDPNVYPYFNNIEEVDIVSSEPLLNAIKHSDLFKDNYKSESIFDYIITSHHFEHLANPIQFLQAAEQLLKPKGILSMAIPIHTRCFDLYKPLSSSGMLIDAFINNATSPSVGTVFNHLTFGAHKIDGSPIGSPYQSNKSVKLIWDEIENFQMQPNFNKIDWFNQLKKNVDNNYVDAHCNFFNPASFCLILADLKMIGLLNHLEVHYIYEHGMEFIVHLKKGKPENPHPCSNMTRTELVQAACQNSAHEIDTSESDKTNFDFESSKMLDEILKSRSWQITKPYRAIGRLIDKIFFKLGIKSSA
jgi:SAM-dependent methyltransferase